MKKQTPPHWWIITSHYAARLYNADTREAALQAYNNDFTTTKKLTPHVTVPALQCDVCGHWLLPLPSITLHMTTDTCNPQHVCNRVHNS